MHQDADFFDKLLDGDLVPGLKNEDVLDAISASETALALKELNETDSTPTPTRKARNRDITPTLQLPTRLRVRVTPTKKAPPEMVRVFNARRHCLEAATSAFSSIRSGSVLLPATSNLGQSVHAEMVRERHHNVGNMN